MMHLREAVFILTFQTKIEKEGLVAVKLLQKAPALECWNRGLLAGLHCGHSKIENATVTACILRLEQLTQIQDQDCFFRLLLEACFLNSAHSVELFNAIATFCNQQSGEREHYRSRLLARTRQIIQLPDCGKLAQAVVHFLIPRPAVYRARQYETYMTLGSSQEALLAYLHADENIAVLDVPEELIKAYCGLLEQQTHAHHAVLKALHNLKGWLQDLIPLEAEQRQILLQDAFRAAAKVPLDELGVPVKQHLEFNLRLLPGKQYSGDLLNLLRTCFVFAQREEILVSGLGLLSKLFLMRFRASEVCAFMMDASRWGRSRTAWQAFFELFKNLLAGPEFTPPNHLEKTMAKRYQRAVKTARKPDQEITTLLHHISFLQENVLSHDAELEIWIRQTAFITLLSGMPINRSQLMCEALHTIDLLVPVLQYAADMHQCEIWQTFTENFASLFAQSESYMALIACFKKTRNYDAVRNSKGQKGPLLQLAMDQDDPCIQKSAVEALLTTGYALELQREQLKHELKDLSDELSNSNSQVMVLEEEITQLTKTMDDLHSQRCSLTLNIQDLTRERDLLTTRGWLDSAGLHLNLAEIRRKLSAALHAMDQHREEIKTINTHIEDQSEQCRDLQEQSQHLESLRDQHVDALKNYSKQLHQTEKKLSKIKLRINAAQDESTQLTDAYKQTPSGRHVEENQRRLIIRAQSLSEETQGIVECQDRIKTYEHNIIQTRQTIDDLNDALFETNHQIRKMDYDLKQQKNKSSSQRINRIELETIIASCQKEVSTYQAQIKQAGQQQVHILKLNQEKLEIARSHLDQHRLQLHSLATKLHSTQELFNQKLNLCQELTNSINNGRLHYDQLADQAATSSMQANTEGLAMQVRVEAEAYENLKFGVVFAYGLKRAAGL